MTNNQKRDYAALVARLRENANIDEMEGCIAAVVALEREAANAIESLSTQLPLPSREVVAWLVCDGGGEPYSLEWTEADAMMVVSHEGKIVPLCRCDAPALPKVSTVFDKHGEAYDYVAGPDRKGGTVVFVPGHSYYAIRYDIAHHPDETALPADKGAEEPGELLPIVELFKLDLTDLYTRTFARLDYWMLRALKAEGKSK